jgi:iron complex transport system ATP-binding protein
VPALLELNNATVVRSGRRILDGITLEIPLGRHTAIFGPNGSGKSSLIKLITRDLYPLATENGRPPIRILGEERWDVNFLRTKLGIVTRDLEHAFTSGDERTGYEIVASGFFASHGIFSHHRITPIMERRAMHALSLMEAEHLARKPVQTMSTGEARRILIARALVPDPLALLLDEPTVALDLVARRRFLERVRQIAGEGKPVILVTHHVEEILPEIEHVILLKDGRVFRDGPKSECLTDTVLTELLGSRVTIHEQNGYLQAEVTDGDLNTTISRTL